MTKLYSEWALDWYQLLSPLEDYEEEADQYQRYFSESETDIKTMLELGSGAGHNAYFMKQWYAITLADLSEHMLAVSRRHNPELEHVQGDMRTLRLGRTFDAVFIHDAIMYMTTLGELRRALETAFVHLRPGGIVVVTPDFVQETFKPGTDDGGADGDGRGLRFLEWMTDPNPGDHQVTVDYVYALRHEDGTLSVEVDRMTEGLFSQDEWLRTMQAVGFEAEALDDPKWGRVNFRGTKPEQ